MSSFRRPVTVLRESPGAYVSGLFVPGARKSITIQASVQPMSGQDMVNAPEGRRIEDLIKVYSETPLLQALGTQQPDIVVWQGYGYEVSSMDVRQMGVISHYKIFATRRMPVPSVSAWAAGTLTRG